MREILFRGKRKDNGEWVYGYYEFYNGGHYINIQIDRVNSGGYPIREFIEIDPSTVGQYTGLTANGTKIFEGDIVEGNCHSRWSHRLQRCVVVYDRDSFKSRHYLNFPNEKHYFEYKVLFSKDVVVIGNIHDNPELLESEVRE